MRAPGSGPNSAVGLSPLDLEADWHGTLDTVLSTVDKLFTESAGPCSCRRRQIPSGSPNTVRAWAGQRASGLLETATAEIAARAVEGLGVRRLLVAGGETSGAVVQRLGLGTVRVGPAAEPGLPWMTPTSGPRLALLLKCGNFGAADLFARAWDACP